MHTRSTKPPVSRRTFIGVTAAGAGSLLLGCGDDATAVSASDTATSAGDTAAPEPDAQGADVATPDGLGPRDDLGGAPDSEAPDVEAAPDLAVPDGKAAVAIVGVGADVLAAVRRAVELAGGLDAIAPGDSVFIKPNAVHPFAVDIPGVLTSPEVLAAVVTLVKERGAGHITVGDRSARGFDSAASLQDTGLAEAALGAGADEIYGAKSPKDDADAWVLVQPTGWEASWAPLGGVLVLKKIVESDHFINLAVCKNHRWGGFSLSMKNLMGAVGDESRDRMHYVANDVDQLAKDIAVLNSAFSPLMNLIDARTCMFNGGPEGILGDAVTTTPGLILASADRVALDAMGAAVIQLEQSRNTAASPDAVQDLLKNTAAWKLPQVLRGAEQGLGVTSAEAVLTRFEGAADAALLEARFRAV